MNKMNKTNDQVITKALTPKQLKRLNEISVQQRGTRALTDPEVAKALVLSSKQKQEIEDIQNGARDAMREQFTAMAESGGFGNRGGGGGFGRPGGNGAQGENKPGLQVAIRPNRPTRRRQPRRPQPEASQRLEASQPATIRVAVAAVVVAEAQRKSSARPWKNRWTK